MHLWISITSPDLHGYLRPAYMFSQDSEAVILLPLK